MFHAGKYREQEGSRIVGPHERKFWSIVYGADLQDQARAPMPQARHRGGRRRPHAPTGETNQAVGGTVS